MAHFYGTIKHKDSVTSRTGTSQHGLTITLNGWNKGIKVVASHRNNEDVFEVYETGGSNEIHEPKLLVPT